MEPSATASIPWNIPNANASPWTPLLPVNNHHQPLNVSQPTLLPAIGTSTGFGGVGGGGGDGDASALSQSLALVAMLLIDLLAIMGNLAVMTVIACTPQLRKFVFVFHLCMVDLLAALVLLPLAMLTDQPFFSDALCRGYLCLSMGLICATILTICAINVERYYYIVYPMRYEVKMTVGLVVMVLVGVWVKAVLMSAFPLLGWALTGTGSGSLGPGGAAASLDVGQRRCSLHWAGGSGAVVGEGVFTGGGGSGGTARLVFMVLFTLMYFLCPVLIILVVYCNMFKVARVAAMQPGHVPTWMDTPRQQQQQQQQQQPRSESISSHSSMAASLGPSARGVTPQRTFSGGKAAMVLVAVGGQFLACWLPYFSYHLYSALAPSASAASVPGAGAATLTQLEDVVTWIGYSCFASNPVFYGCLNRQIREELWRQLSCLLGLLGGRPRREEEQLPSREASIEENFLQFLQGTGCNLEPRNSHSISGGVGGGTQKGGGDSVGGGRDGVDGDGDGDTLLHHHHHRHLHLSSEPCSPTSPCLLHRPSVDLNIPGQIVEETSEFTEQHHHHHLNNDLLLSRADNCHRTCIPDL